MELWQSEVFNLYKILEFFNVPQPVPQRYVAKDIHKWQLYGNK